MGIFDKYTPYKYLFVKNSDISTKGDVTVVTLEILYK